MQVYSLSHIHTHSHALHTFTHTHTRSYLHFSGDELLLTEMIFNGAFNDLSVEQCVALMSCFVFEEKVSSNSVVVASFQEVGIMEQWCM